MKKRKYTDEEKQRMLLSYRSAMAEKSRLGLWRSRALKKRATLPERTLLEALRANRYWLKFQGYFYTDTHLYIPDFRLATAQYKLLIEVDGPSHQQQQAYDAARTAWLEQNRNAVILRFTNDEVMTQIEKVLEKIAEHDPLRFGEKRTTLSKAELRKQMKHHPLAVDADPAEQFKRFI